MSKVVKKTTKPKLKLKSRTNKKKTPKKETKSKGLGYVKKILNSLRETFENVDHETLLLF